MTSSQRAAKNDLFRAAWSGLFEAALTEAGLPAASRTIPQAVTGALRRYPAPAVASGSSEPTHETRTHDRRAHTLATRRAA